jgi:CDP-diglyceride synthetase
VEIGAVKGVLYLRASIQIFSIFHSFVRFGKKKSDTGDGGSAKILEWLRVFVKISAVLAHTLLNPLTPELNPSAQRCPTRFFLGILLLEPYISLIYAWKTNKSTNTPILWMGVFCLVTWCARTTSLDTTRQTQYSIDRSSIEHLSEGTSNAP